MNLLEEVIDDLLNMDCDDRDEVVATVGDVVAKLRQVVRTPITPTSSSVGDIQGTME